MLDLSKIQFFIIFIREAFCVANSPPGNVLRLSIFQEICIFHSDRAQIRAIVDGRKQEKTGDQVTVYLQRCLYVILIALLSSDLKWFSITKLAAQY